MLFLERKRKSVDDRAKNLQKLSNAIKTLGLIYELKEDVVDGSSNE